MFQTLGKSGSENQSGRRRGGRPDHRAHSDANAHNSPSEQEHLNSPPPTLADAPSSAAELVATDAELAALLEHLRSEKSFAYDSEFIGELTYVPKLCLIQVCTRTRVAMIDPLAKIDLKPFWEILTDPSIEKIVHAGQQDIEPVFRNIGKAAANLFDAQIAAGFAGLGYPLSLSRLVGAVTGVKLSKGLTFTHWDRRPLSAQQLRYAADDVRYLPAVRNELGNRLTKLGHFTWASEESNSLADPAMYGFDPEAQFLKIRGSSGLPRRNLAILRNLTLWRDATARQENIPARSLVRDEVLLDIARHPPASVEDLNKVRGLPRPVEAAHGREIIDAVKKAQAVAVDQLPMPRSYDPAPREKFSADSLWASAQCLCAGRQIDINVVASRQEVGDFYHQHMSGEENDSRLLVGWRKEALGQDLLELLAGKLKLSATWSGDGLETKKG